jgi:hypothetical protein
LSVSEAAKIGLHGRGKLGKVDFSATGPAHRELSPQIAEFRTYSEDLQDSTQRLPV